MMACDMTDYPYEPMPTASGEALRRCWDVAFGLQQVDGLEPSGYARRLADATVEGSATLAESGSALRAYYRRRDAAGEATPEGEREADLVSQRIAELLAADSFALVPSVLSTIHRALFQDLDAKTYRPGEYKTEPLAKRETVLNGDSVVYGAPEYIAPMLAYLFEQETGSYYGVAFDAERLVHFASFISHIWQVHPFVEGNTRTTAVFAELYLRNLGFDAENEPFERHARYFRDALVRANYRNARAGVEPDASYLVIFFENMLCGASNELRSRDLLCLPLFDDPSLLCNLPPEAR